MTAADVQELIVQPMLRLYVAPAHLKTQTPPEREAVLREYTDALADYAASTLAQAWRTVVQEHTLAIWPPPGVFVAAAKRVPQTTATAPDPEAEKRLEADTRAAHALAQYMKRSQLARAAKKDGWLGYLWAYADAASRVQAALLCGQKSVSFDSVLTKHLGQFDSASEALHSYAETVRGSLAKGEVRITVPRVLIDEWKDRAQQANQQPGRPRG